MKNLLAPAVDWTGGSWAERLDMCATMLSMHGYIPSSLRHKIGATLVKQCEAARAQGTEAGTAETATEIGGSVHDGPVRDSECAP